jgi:hypothetical protein
MYRRAVKDRKMTDIVERLRKQAWQRSGAPKMDAGHSKMLEWMAADEIERLQTKLVRIKNAIEEFAAATKPVSLTIQKHDPSWEAWKKLCDACNE